MTQPSTDTGAPPRRPKVSHRLFVIAGEDWFFGILSSRAAHQYIANVFRHGDHALIAILGFAKIDNPAHEIDLGDSQGKEFIGAPAVSVGCLEEPGQPLTFNRALARQAEVLLVKQKTVTDVVLLQHIKVGNKAQLGRGLFSGMMKR